MRDLDGSERHAQPLPQPTAPAKAVPRLTSPEVMAPQKKRPGGPGRFVRIITGVAC